MKLLLFIITLLFVSDTSELTGKVIHVADGDTITILTADKKQVKIRLDAIDCPETKQDFGRKAKELTTKLCAGKQVRIVAREKDRYGRVLGYVMVGDTNVNEELLKAGLAWHYKYFNKSKKLAELERVARNKKIGLWSQPAPVAPWDFRKAQKSRTIS